MSHRSNPVVVGGCQTGDAVLFRVDAHTAELQNLEFSAVLGQAHLLIQGWAMIVCHDGDGRHQHNRAGHDDANQGHKDVKGTLDEQIFRRRLGPAHAHQRYAEHLHIGGSGHDDVAHMGSNVALYVLLHTIFDDTIS